MGEHAVYIWASYGVAAVVLLALAVHIWRDAARQRSLLTRLEERGASRRGPVRTVATTPSDTRPGTDAAPAQAEGS